VTSTHPRPVVVLPLLLALAGCGQPTTGARQIGAGALNPRAVVTPVSRYAGAPNGAEPSRRGGRIVPATASWLDHYRRIQITVWGSGSCPAVGDHARYANDGNTLTLTLRIYPPGRQCTTDVAPATTVLPVPRCVRGADEFKVTVQGGATDMVVNL
jgi:hypothetical protein